MLVADIMCYDGVVKGAVRTGIVSAKKSTLAKAAFEQTEKVLFDAAFENKTELFNGVIENVIAGLPIHIGTGKIELKMDFKKFEGIKVFKRKKKEESDKKE